MPPKETILEVQFSDLNIGDVVRMHIVVDPDDVADPLSSSTMVKKSVSMLLSGISHNIDDKQPLIPECVSE
jgi:hypothetical protein